MFNVELGEMFNMWLCFSRMVVEREGETAPVYRGKSSSLTPDRRVSPDALKMAGRKLSSSSVLSLS